MNVLFLSELFYPQGGGAEWATYLYANMLSKSGFTVAVITNRTAGEPETSKDGDITIYRLSLFEKRANVKYSILRRFDVLLSSFLRKMIRWADVVYVPRYWYSAIPVSKSCGKPVLVHLHDYVSVCPLAILYNTSEEAVCRRTSFSCPTACIYLYEKSQGKKLNTSLPSAVLNSTFGHYMRWLGNIADATIFVSHEQKRLTLAKGFLSRAKTYVVYNPQPEIPYTAMEGDGFAYFGGYSLMKGYRVLCKALRNISHNQVTLRGTGFNQQSRNSFRISDKVEFHRNGWVQAHEMREVYRSSRAVIVPSICPEPLPYVIYEALLNGRLIIASRIGGIPEQTVGYSGCYLFTPGDYKELSNLIEYVSSIDREEALEIGLRNRSIFLNSNHNEKSLRDFIRIIENFV